MALVAPGGDVEWMCLPRPDSPSVFGALLDRDAGSFRVGPTNVAVPAGGGRYLPGTMVLETTWMTRTGWLVVHDALVVGPWHHEESARARIDACRPTTMLTRARPDVSCVHGSVELQVECEPASTTVAARRVGIRRTRLRTAAARAPGSDLELRLATDLRLGLEGGARGRA